MRFSGVILAGGRSSRMGRDKAWIEHAGQTLLANQLQTLVELELDEIFISGGPGTDYSRFGYPVLLDREKDQGPLAGVERALAAANNELLLVLAIDMPRMTTAYLNGLASLASEGRGWVPRLHGRFEPLAAAYPKACHDLARAILDSGLPKERTLGDLKLEVGHALRCAPSKGVRETLAGVQGTARPTETSPLTESRRPQQDMRGDQEPETSNVQIPRVQGSDFEAERSAFPQVSRKPKGSMRHFVTACRQAGLVEIVDVAAADEPLFSNWNRPEDVIS